MVDIDLIASLDPVTGLPQIDDRSTARRWLEALDEGPACETLTNKSFGKVSAEQLGNRTLLTGAHKQPKEYEQQYQ